MSGIDFAALGTGMDIRQALDVLDDVEGDVGPDDVHDAVEVVRAALEKLEHRLNVARRTAWVAAPIAWRLVKVGDVIVGKDGRLLPVLETDSAEGLDRPDWWRIVIPGRAMDSTDGDRPVPVLRRPTADALDILARQLGAQEITKETTT